MYKKIKAKGVSLKKKLSGSDDKKSSKIEEISKSKTRLENEKLDVCEDCETNDDIMLYDGDCYFEAGELLIENSDEEDNDDAKFIQR